MNDSRGFTVDADQLAGWAAEFPGLAARAGAVHRELSDALAEVGQCWGTDTVGRSFSAAHAGPAQTTLGGIGSLADRLGSVGTRLADTAAAYRAQDAAGAGQVTAADER